MSAMVSPQPETDGRSKRMRIRTLGRRRNRLVQSGFRGLQQTAFHHDVGKPDPTVRVFRLKLGQGLKLQERELPVSETEFQRCKLVARRGIARLKPKRSAELIPCLIELAGGQMRLRPFQTELCPVRPEETIRRDPR